MGESATSRASTLIRLHALLDDVDDLNLLAEPYSVQDFHVVGSFDNEGKAG